MPLFYFYRETSHNFWQIKCLRLLLQVCLIRVDLTWPRDQMYSFRHAYVKKKKHFLIIKKMFLPFINVCYTVYLNTMHLVLWPHIILGRLYNEKIERIHTLLAVATSHYKNNSPWLALSLTPHHPLPNWDGTYDFDKCSSGFWEWLIMTPSF